ncbi:hypothetical protein J6590_047249 [Homalodisca vitripennis]|nr:hypothetical protein J6590_047249 [Homalodisca vitripennis]
MLNISPSLIKVAQSVTAANTSPINPSPPIVPTHIGLPSLTDVLATKLLEMRTITQFGMEGRDKQRRPSLLDCNKSHRAGQFGISLDNSNNELCRAASADPAPSRSLLQL